jgi:hypothetical protein
MRRRERGTIVQVSSALAFRSIPLQSAYCAAKHAVMGFTESLRSELFHDRIRVHLTLVHMPAVNTPQFSWVRSRLPNEAQPVPPIFQPEVAADAIVWAATHRRRSISVGTSAAKAILGEKFIPGLLDRYLAWKGFSSQQTLEPRSEHRDNLFAPVAEDRGAHGTFDDRSRARSLQLWLNTRRGWAALGGVALALGAVGASRNFLAR